LCLLHCLQEQQKQQHAGAQMQQKQQHLQAQPQQQQHAGTVQVSGGLSEHSAGWFTSQQLVSGNRHNSIAAS
jgi:hypothetical protein